MAKKNVAWANRFEPRISQNYVKSKSLLSPDRKNLN